MLPMMESQVIVIYGGGSGTWIMIKRLLDRVTYPTSHLLVFVSRQFCFSVNLRELLDLISWMCSAFVSMADRRNNDVGKTIAPESRCQNASLKELCASARTYQRLVLVSRRIMEGADA